MAALRDNAGRFRSPPEPDPGPYWIECDLTQLGPVNCHVVDTRQPNPDPTGEGGQGWVSVFSGSYTECDAWLEANA